MSRSIVVTGCDAAHYELAADLLASLRDTRGSTLTIGFIHVGDEPPPPAIADAADHIVQISDQEFPAEQRRGFRFAYLMLKPRIPEFFPGYDVYAWLDGDTWVQNPLGLDQVIYSARFADICVHPERDPNYASIDGPRDYLQMVYTSIYGPEEARWYSFHASFNAGVFAARVSSPVWRLWKEALADVRRRALDGADVHFSDQIPLHRLIVSRQVSMTPLRAVNNWLTLFSTPAVNLERKRLLAPSYPFEEINIIHLLGKSKEARFRLGDQNREITFRYRDIKALFAG